MILVVGANGSGKTTMINAIYDQIAVDHHCQISILEYTLTNLAETSQIV